MFVIETSHKDKDATLSKPMEFPEACEVFSNMTGMDTSKFKEGEHSDGIITLREASIEELVYKENGILIVDHIIEGFSDDRFNIAWKRTAREFGGLEPDAEDLEAEDKSEFAENFEEEYHHQLELMAAKDLMGYFEKAGIIETVGVDKEGQVQIEITDKGHEFLD